MENFSRGVSNRVLIKDFFNGSQALSLVGDFFAWSEDWGNLNAQRFCSKSLELFTEDDRV